MPSEGRVDWYWLTLMVGTAIVFFVIGCASTVWWFGGAARPVAALARDVALAAGGKPLGGPTGSAAGAGPGTSAESINVAPASGDAAPAKSAASAGQPTASPASAGQGSPPGPALATPAAASPGQTAAAAAAAGSTAQPTPQAGNFSLQLGAFLDAANAKLLVGRLAAAGYAPVSIDAPDSGGHVWHYVRLGAFADQYAASLSAAEVLAQTGIAAVIVRGSATSAGG
jgi:cell division septation protein DedD